MTSVFPLVDNIWDIQSHISNLKGTIIGASIVPSMTHPYVITSTVNSESISLETNYWLVSLNVISLEASNRIGNWSKLC